jgi:signal peptide peptidase SppA
VRNQTISRALAGTLWCIHQPRFNEILALLEVGLASEAPARVHFFSLLRAEQERREAAVRAISGSAGMVAVIPVYGILAQRGSFWSMCFGGSSCDAITAQLRAAVNDPNVKAIVMDFDSPGGDVAGISELGSEILQARKQKPIVAVSNSLCASAAYWLASQATELLVSPSSNTGSIGVYMLHEEYSQAMANAGIKDTIIKFGENKAEGNDSEPLTDQAREHFQALVDSTGDDFEKAVARGRKVGQDEVHKKFGQGRLFDAKTAVKLGMADRIGTFDDALAKHGASRKPLSGAVAFPSSVAALVASADTPEPDTDDRQDSGAGNCACACAECKAGDCNACTHAACACDGCACDNAATARKSKHAMERRRLELAAA